MNGRGIAFFAYGSARRLSNLPIARQLIPGWLRKRAQMRLSSGVMDLLPDRRYLAETILPTVASLQPARLLDVGVREYSQHHGQLLPQNCERWTADVDPGAVVFGEPGRHVVADVADLDRHFAPGSFDVVILNGLFGHGVDRLEEQEQAVAVARRLLRPGGWLLVGWNRGSDGKPITVSGAVPHEQPIRDPLELAEIAQGFVHEAPGDLPARHEFTDSSHIFDWFRAC